jgi:hypothetical protein
LRDGDLVVRLLKQNKIDVISNLQNLPIIETAYFQPWSLTMLT